MNKRLIAIIFCGILALTTFHANASSLTVIDSGGVTPPAVSPIGVKPRIEIEGVSTAEGNLLRLIGIDSREVDCIDFEVTIAGAQVKDLEPFTEMLEGRLFATLVRETPDEQILKCHWDRTRRDDCKVTSLANIYLDNTETPVTVSTHVNVCISRNYVTADIDDVANEVWFSEATETNIDAPAVGFIYATDSELGIHIRTDNSNAVAVLAIYDEAGRMVSTQMKPVSGLEIDGKGFYLWTIKSNKLKAPSRAKVMLLDKNFCPLCEPGEITIS